ncbi:MAG: hypothetical protein WBX15_18775 [Thermoanaerobaculia bacterium]
MALAMLLLLAAGPGLADWNPSLKHATIPMPVMGAEVSVPALYCNRKLVQLDSVRFEADPAAPGEIVRGEWVFTGRSRSGTSQRLKVIVGPVDVNGNRMGRFRSVGSMAPHAGRFEIRVPMQISRDQWNAATALKITACWGY